MCVNSEFVFKTFMHFSYYDMKSVRLSVGSDKNLAMCRTCKMFTHGNILTLMIRQNQHDSIDIDEMRADALRTVDDTPCRLVC